MLGVMLPLLLALSALTPGASAAPAELVVLGLHVPDRTLAQALEDQEALARALEAGGTVDVPDRDEVARRLAGREVLVLDGWALGAGRERLKEGRVLYERAVPDQAVATLEEATKLLAQGLALSTDTRPLHEAYVYLGMTKLGLGDEPGARSAFLRAATLDPSRRLDALNFPPDTVDLYEAERAAVAGAVPATVQFAVADVPEGTRAWLDGRELPGLADKAIVAPGTHFLLVRTPDGRSDGVQVRAAAGERKSVTVRLDSRTLGDAAKEPAGRSRQARDLYRALGQHLTTSPLVLAGTLPDGKAGLQLYDPVTGNFSRVVSADAEGDPVGALTDVAGTLANFLQDGRLRADRVAPQALALDVGTNEVLAEMLLAPRAPEVEAPPPVVVTERRGLPWYAWTSIGLLAAGGGAAAAIVATQSDSTPPAPVGTVTVGPLP
jgi:hypothetical protein